MLPVQKPLQQIYYLIEYHLQSRSLYFILYLVGHIAKADRSLSCRTHWNWIPWVGIDQFVVFCIESFGYVFVYGSHRSLANIAYHKEWKKKMHKKL